MCQQHTAAVSLKLQHIHVPYALISARINISCLCKGKGWYLQCLTAIQLQSIQTVSHPGHEQAQCFKLLHAKLDADLSPVLEDAFSSYPLNNSPDIGFSLATYNTEVFFDCQVIINLRLGAS